MDGIEDVESDIAKNWQGFLEKYTFNTVDDGTELIIDIDMVNEMVGEMEIVWDKALKSLKELAEK